MTTTKKKQLLSRSDNQELTIIVRDKRKPGWYWADNTVVDDYTWLIGDKGLALYTVYCRRVMNNSQSAEIEQEVLARLLGLRKATISKLQRLCEWCGLFHVERKHRATSEVFLLEVRPITPEILDEIRQRIYRDTGPANSPRPKYVALRQYALSRLDSWTSLNQLIDEQVEISRGKKIHIVKASEQQMALDLGMNEPADSVNPNGHQLVTESPETQLWRKVQDELKATMTAATYNAHIADSCLLNIEETEAGQIWTVAVVENSRGWLEERLANLVTKAASLVAERPVQLRFVTRSN